MVASPKLPPHLETAAITKESRTPRPRRGVNDRRIRSLLKNVEAN
jgi:hypothetical protein